MKDLIKKSLLKIKYRKLFEELNITLNNCEIRSGINIMLVLDRKKKIVYRCPLNELGKIAVLKNYGTLEELKEGVAPEFSGKWQNDGLLVTAERLLPGEKIKITDINQHLLGLIFSKLSLLYGKNIVKVDFDTNEWFANYDYLLNHYNRFVLERISRIRSIIKKKIFTSYSDQKQVVINTRIHGDLTFRNIISEKDKVYFVDFDRSEISFPEFDLFLFYMDYLTYAGGEITYDSFFNNILNFIEEKNNFDWIDKFYKLNYKFELNRPLDLQLRYLFLYRVLVHILQSFSIFDLAPLKLLDNIYDRVKEINS